MTDEYIPTYIAAWRAEQRRRQLHRRAVFALKLAAGLGTAALAMLGMSPWAL